MNEAARPFRLDRFLLTGLLVRLLRQQLRMSEISCSLLRPE